MAQRYTIVFAQIDSPDKSSAATGSCLLAVPIVYLVHSFDF